MSPDAQTLWDAVNSQITWLAQLGIACTEIGGLTMPVDEYMKAACWIVCPMCDEPKCVGRFNCPEIKAWIEKKRRADDATD